MVVIINYSDIKKFTKYLSPADVVTEAMLLILTLIYIFYNTAIDLWYVFIPLNLLLVYLIW
jgi:hypothetical protein